jgi:DNA (cytosine-5)-methyltransferase 1
MSNYETYFVNRKVSEKYAPKKPLKEMARTLLAEKSFCGGGVLSVKENTMTEKEINELGRDYALHPNKYEESENETKNYHIRKLTPKECWRLMGVKDEDFEKVAKNQSNSSLYHLAGDSIVVDVLMAIFKQML